METSTDLVFGNGPTAMLSIPPPSALVKTLSNVSTTSTVTIDSAFSDSSTSPKSVSQDNHKGIPPKSPHSLPPLPSFSGRSRSVSTESFRKRGGLDPRRSPSSRKKGSHSRRSSSMSAASADQSSLGSSVTSVTPKSANERLLRKLRKAIKRYGEKDPSVAAIYTALGNLHFREGRISEAINSYKGAIDCREGPHSATAYLNLGTAYWNQMDVPQATHYLKKALKHLKRGCSLRGVSPELCPEVASCHHQLGLVYALGHQNEAAVREIETACRMRLAMYGAAHPMTARTLDAAGRIHTLRGDYDQALHCHEQALTVLQGTPYAASTLENIAMAHTGRGDVLAAVHVYVEIVQSMKALWHFEMSKPYYQRNQGVAQQLSDYLGKLGESYRKLRHDAYAHQCKEEAEMVLLDSGLAQFPGQGSQQLE
mmetsp:Transcript_22752/g.63271  ORF Transcript_22752/g.63271 Transcript_22752/m.63271 type:complete len:425 (+) Transcript_22752:139-1413(+)|eukprot:CAMPEP_0168762926 /NCGR_PEP_ID=MMETSP0724-20121128/24097_1 /TAXON_ID=265536 /ORGANISM="Amphiprora sp., Strain CCMP467" /LENGTH=424 /DNA_ID=CAMNT_0008812109 /DNA_START=224 /DNA_END=1498 /DNA_ORIENTATION=+